VELCDCAFCLSVYSPFNVYAVDGHPRGVIAKQNECGIGFSTIPSVKVAVHNILSCFIVLIVDSVNHS
jgi:hypothetical protein